MQPSDNEVTLTLRGKDYKMRGVALRMIEDALKYMMLLNSEDFKGTLTYNIGRGNIDTKVEVTATG